MKSTGLRVWMFLRIARWLSWIGFLAYSSAFAHDRSSYLDKFGHPFRATEAWMFGLFFAAAIAGLLELMMRERAGIARPEYFHLMPPVENGPP